MNRTRNQQESGLYDFNELLSALDEIDQWLTRIGFTNIDRVRKYQRNIRRMIEAQQSGQMADLERSMPLNEAREVLWSYVEGDELVRAIRGLRRYYDAELKPLLKAVLKGPTDLFLETAKTKQPRDRFFELVMAGRLASAGYKPLFDRVADISFDFATMQLDLECKRTLTESGIEEVISKGLKQLDHGRSDMGFIALSLSRIIVPGDPGAIPTVAAGSAVAYLEQRFSQIIEPARRFWESKPSPRFGGVWFYAFVPIRVEPGPPFYAPTRLEKIASMAKGPMKDIQQCLLSTLNEGDEY